MKNEHEHFVNVLMDMAKSVEGEKNAFDLYDVLYEDSKKDKINYGYKQLEISAFELEHAIRKHKDNDNDFALAYTDDRPDKERPNYRPDFFDEVTHRYVDAKLHCAVDSEAILNDKHAMEYIINKQGNMYVLVAEATYTPDDGTYRAYRELRNGGKSKYQKKNKNIKHRMIKVATTINQLAIYRLDSAVLAKNDAISIMNQGHNSNGNERNQKLILDLSAISPVAAIKAETNDDGSITWHECDGKFNSNLCGERSASASLIAKIKQIQETMEISPESFETVVPIKIRKYDTNEKGEKRVWIEPYTRSDNVHVKGHWRVIH